MEISRVLRSKLIKLRIFSVVVPSTSRKRPREDDQSEESGDKDVNFSISEIPTIGSRVRPARTRKTPLRLVPSTSSALTSAGRAETIRKNLATSKFNSAIFKRIDAKPFSIDSSDQWAEYEKLATSADFKATLIHFFKTSPKFTVSIDYRGNHHIHKFRLMMNYMFTEKFLESHVRWNSSNKSVNLSKSSMNEVSLAVFPSCRDAPARFFKVFAEQMRRAQRKCESKYIVQDCCTIYSNLLIKILFFLLQSNRHLIKSYTATKFKLKQRNQKIHAKRMRKRRQLMKSIQPTDQKCSR